ncbi:hypothetical protein HRbin17_00296 [bacterium HR17]|uniref:TadE-like domain-containing protein n=1 Tax=Candidatus Fervidibacter japonicus TaxID=2035412 RepID=A0A2H5X9G2_9BACT|nr:hypothetical protein HRbin17_00296 [bacterium HR17]
MRRGQVLVEFAVSIGLFALLLLGLVESGRYAFAVSTLTNAVREGARYATLRPYDIAGIAQRVRSSTASLDRSQISVQVTYSSLPPVSGSVVTVTASYPFRSLLGAFSRTVTVAAQMRVP